MGNLEDNSLWPRGAIFGTRLASSQEDSHSTRYQKDKVLGLHRRMV